MLLMASDEAQTQYQNVHRDVRKNLREDKEEWMEKQCSAIEKELKSDGSKKTHITLKSLTKTSDQKAAVIDNKYVKILR